MASFLLVQLALSLYLWPFWLIHTTSTTTHNLATILPHTVLIYSPLRLLEKVCLLSRACNIGPSGEGACSYLSPKYRGHHTFLSLPELFSQNVILGFLPLLVLIFYTHPTTHHAPIIMKYL